MSNRRCLVVASVVLMLGYAVLVGGSQAGRSASREPRAVAETQRWHLIWRDEFTGRSGAAVDQCCWRFDVGGRWGNGQELQYYTAQNAALDGHGHLVITARRERYVGPDGVARGYTSSRLNTQHRFEFTYGRVAARISVPASEQGLHPAFWAAGSNLDTVGWPRAGEFDVMEVFGTDPSMLLGSIHGPAADGSAYALTTRRSVSLGFHVYSVTWSPARLSFAVDGRNYGVLTPRSLPSGARWSFDGRPFFLILSLAVGGPWAGTPDAMTRWPAHMVVDWVRVWQTCTRPTRACATLPARTANTSPRR